MSQPKKEIYLIILVFSVYLLGYVLIGKYPFYRIDMYSSKMDEVYYYEITDEKNQPYDFGRLTTPYLKTYHAQSFLNPKFDAYFVLHKKMGKEELNSIAQFIFKSDSPQRILVTRFKGTSSPVGHFDLIREDQWEFRRD